MHIIQIITSLTPAGAEKVVLNLSIDLQKKGHEVTVISLFPKPNDQDIINELTSNGINIYYLNVSKLTSYRIFKLASTINRIIAKSQYSISETIIHTHLFHATIAARLSKLINSKLKIVTTIHIADTRKSKFYYFLADYLTLNLSNTITAVSKFAQSFNAKRLFTSLENIEVIYNGINIPGNLSTTEIDQFKVKYGIAHNDKIIGSIGRLDKQKGYDYLFSLISEISKIVPDKEIWYIVIIGDGNQREALEKISSALLIKNIKIILPGFKFNAASYIAMFDLFIMPSRFEGFGLSLAEAMMFGVPILISNLDVLKEVISDYEPFDVFDFNEEKKNIVGKINKLINTPHGKPSYKYSVDKMTDSYVKFYSKLSSID